jgi:hypothetical protein
MAPIFTGFRMGFGRGVEDAGGPLGTQSNPATSALAILANNPTAASGPYWITVGGVATELYCDMTTDGGGFMLVAKYNGTGGSNTSSSNVANLNNLTATSSATHKLSDTDIKALAATNGYYEWSPRTPDGPSPTTIYIMRYSAGDWSSWASNGATNMAYESKSSGGTFVSGFNGHINNRGFSTYSDSINDACTTVFSGTKEYLFSFHAAFGSTSNFFVWIR